MTRASWIGFALLIALAPVGQLTADGFDLLTNFSENLEAIPVAFSGAWEMGGGDDDCDCCCGPYAP